MRWMADLNTRVMPEHPFMLLGQTTTADPSRSPAGTESVWAYTHLPRNVADDASAEQLAESMDQVIEEHAPGFGSRVIDAVRAAPVGSGSQRRQPASRARSTAEPRQLQQMLIFRPAPGMGAPKPRSSGCIWAARRRHRVARCTAPADVTRPMPHWPPTGRPAGHDAS